MIPGSQPLALAVVTTRADELRADVLVRVVGPGLPQGDGRPRLQGSLTGPIRGRDTTLPMRVPLVACTAEPAAARATFTEPAFWTPEMPNLYRLEARFGDTATPVAEFGCLVGLRRIRVRGRSFWLDGRRWVPRGVSVPPEAFNAGLLHELPAAAELRGPDHPLLAAADTMGVAVVARLEDVAGSPVDEASAGRMLAAWSLHPAVMIAVLPRTMPVPLATAVVDMASRLKGTMLVGLEVDGGRPPLAVDAALVAAVDCLVLELPDELVPHEAWREWSAEKPLVARRRPEGTRRETKDGDQELVRRRRECDRLQAVLAAWGSSGRVGSGGPVRDWAGYLVSAW